MRKDDETLDFDQVELLYFDFLCDLVHADCGLEDTYVFLCDILHRTEYVWTDEKDHSRAVDGIYLRCEFEAREGVEGVREILSYPCSVLEMLIGVAYRIDFQRYDYRLGDRRDTYFWEFIDNLGLSWATDKVFLKDKKGVIFKEIVEKTSNLVFIFGQKQKPKSIFEGILGCF